MKEKEFWLVSSHNTYKGKVFLLLRQEYYFSVSIIRVLFSSTFFPKEKTGLTDLTLLSLSTNSRIIRGLVFNLVIEFLVVQVLEDVRMILAQKLVGPLMETGIIGGESFWGEDENQKQRKI